MAISMVIKDEKHSQDEDRFFCLGLNRFIPKLARSEYQFMVEDTPKGSRLIFQLIHYLFL